jgi:hypothetical protein
LDLRMAKIGWRHHPERDARDQLVAHIVRLLLGPGEEILDGHAGVALGRGGGHRSILRERG